MAKEYTAGPWKIGNPSKQWNDVYRIIGQGSRQVAQVSTDGARNDSMTNQANALLIAAAPELLEALEELVEHDVARNMDRARAAIAKAKGK